MSKYCITLLVITIISFQATAQTLDKPIITERPKVSYSAHTLSKGELQIETGIIYESTKYNAEDYKYDEDVVHIAATLLRYGLWDDLELRLGVEYLSINYSSYYKPTQENSENSFSGFNGLLLSTKYNLVNENGNIPELSLLLNYRFPSDMNTYSSQDNEETISLFLIAQNSFSKLFKFTLSGGYSDNNFEFSNSRENHGILVAFSLDADLSNNISAFAEMVGIYSPEDKYYLNLGIAYLFTNNFMIDTSFGHSLKGNYPDWFINGGFSVRIPN